MHRRVTPGTVSPELPPPKLQSPAPTPSLSWLLLVAWVGHVRKESPLRWPEDTELQTISKDSGVKLMNSAICAHTNADS